MEIGVLNADRVADGVDYIRDAALFQQFRNLFSGSDGVGFGAPLSGFGCLFLLIFFRTAHDDFPHDPSVVFPATAASSIPLGISALQCTVPDGYFWRCRLRGGPEEE
jgi:hypothetical protein